MQIRLAAALVHVQVQVITLLSLSISALASNAVGSAVISVIRVNQVGYLTAEPKKAIFMSTSAQSGNFEVVDQKSGDVAYSGPLPAQNGGGWSSRFQFTYPLDFGRLQTPGSYFVRIHGQTDPVSPVFRIGLGSELYSNALANAVFFYKSGRDGTDVDPQILNRKACHLSDSSATSFETPVYENDVLKSTLKPTGQKLDVSGGWFDAGDYIKFVETTSYAVGMMLFGIRHYPAVLTAAPDLKNEARFGLDWLLKMWDPDSRTLHYQVGIGDGTADDGSANVIHGDHDFWRLPEADDALNVSAGSPDFYIKYRPTFRAGPPGSKVSPNLAGRMAAAFALGYQVFQKEDQAYASRCLKASQSIFDSALTTGVTQLLTTAPFDYYPEVEWRDDMEWGAAELSLATKVAQKETAKGKKAISQSYLDQAIDWAKQYIAGPNHLQDSLNLYDVSALAHFETAHALKTLRKTSTSPTFKDDLEILTGDLQAQLNQGAAQASHDPFRFALKYSDGADLVPHALGYAVTARFYRELTGSTQFDEFGNNQRDWSLGLNAWGASFIVGNGTSFPLNLHDQLSDLNPTPDGKPGTRLGATPDGPSTDPDIKKPDPKYSEFDGAGVKYVDRSSVWQTVEPALDYTAPTIILFGQQSTPIQ